ncbi:MAG: DUF2085 domain-containing protein [Candidatus Promineifilaceae bacterium]
MINSQTLPFLSGRFGRRATIVLVILGALLVLGIYTATDVDRLAHDPALGVLDYAGYAICHRITDHSLSIAGRQMPLCARCTGMYLGVVLSIVVLGLAGRYKWAQLPPAKVMGVLIGFIALMGIDGINSYSFFFPDFPHLYQPQNWLRLLTGMGTGLAMGVFIFPALAQTLWRDFKWQPALSGFRELFWLVVLALIVVLLVLSNQPILLYVLGVISAVGVVGILTIINTMVLLLATRRDARSTAWRQAAVPLMIGLLLAVTEIAAVSYFRFSLTGTMTGFPGI